MPYLTRIFQIAKHAFVLWLFSYRESSEGRATLPFFPVPVPLVRQLEGKSPLKFIIPKSVLEFCLDALGLYLPESLLSVDLNTFSGDDP